MAQTLVGPPSDAPSPYRWSRAEYLRLAEAGFLGEEPHTELINGLIVEKMPQGNAHILAVSLAFYALQAAFGNDYHLRMQSSLSLGAGSMPEPDVTVLRGAPRDYDGRDPEVATDVALVVEVSDTTLAFDRHEKSALYARHGLAEYWVVNLRGRTVEVRRRPLGEEYAETRVYVEGEAIPVGGGEIAVAELMPRGTELPASA